MANIHSDSFLKNNNCKKLTFSLTPTVIIATIAPLFSYSNSQFWHFIENRISFLLHLTPSSLKSHLLLRFKMVKWTWPSIFLPLHTLQWRHSFIQANIMAQYIFLCNLCFSKGASVYVASFTWQPASKSKVKGHSQLLQFVLLIFPFPCLFLFPLLFCPAIFF